MKLAELKVAQAIVTPGKGILAADESAGTIKRFDSIGVDSTADTRRDYRELLFRSTEAMSKYISGVILFDETNRRHPAAEARRALRRHSRHQGRQGHQAAALQPGRGDHRGSGRVA
jgi:fructose-bisphosphate aldolase class 1